MPAQPGQALDPKRANEYYLKITAPNDPETVLGLFVRKTPHLRIGLGDYVENLIADRSQLPAGARLVVSRVHHSVDEHLRRTYITTRLETELTS